MPRINIEDSLALDERFRFLTKLVGCEFKAFGICYRLWRIAQNYWVPNKLPIPKNIMDLSGLPLKELFDAQLITFIEGGVYAHGSENQFEWLISCHENGKKGGRPKKINNLIKPDPNQTLTRLKPSSSSSSSSSNINKYIVRQAEPDISFVENKTAVNNDIDEYKEAIEYLNSKTGKKFNPASKNNVSLIQKLFKEKYTSEDIKSVVDYRLETWGDDPKMREYLRPSTIFRLSNFENYVVEAKNKKEKMKKITEGLRLDEGWYTHGI